MKRTADKLVDIAAGRPGPKTKTKPKSKPTTKRATRANKATEAVPRPLTDTQKTVVQLIHNGHSISAAMDKIRMSRRTFYEWREKNPRFQHATRNAREDYRGLVTDGLEDLQVATAQFLDACIRSDNLSVRDRLRAANTFLRHVQSGAFVPASFPGDDPNPTLIDDDLTGPDFTGSDLADNDLTSDPLAGLGDHSAAEPSPAPNLDPAAPHRPVNQAPTAENPAQNPTQNPTETHRPGVQSATATVQSPTTEPTPSEHSPLAESKVNSIHTEISEKTVQSVQSKSTETSPSSTPRDKRSDVAPTPGEQRSDLANTTPAPENQTTDPSPAPPAPPQKPRKPETLLADAYLNATFLHKHESREAFERLLKHQLRAYAPATPQEELLTFRITQKSWILRRLDTFDRVIADSAVTKIREKHPNAAPAACIAMTYLTRNDTEETRFHDRIAQQRKDQEAALDRLEAKLQTLQHRRQSREDRKATTHRPAVSIPLPGTFFQRRTRDNAQPALEVAPAHFITAATPSVAA